MKLIVDLQPFKKGLKKYFTGIPCKHGHISESFVYEYRCVECKRAKDRRFAKQKNLQLAIRDIKNQKKEELQEKFIC